MADMLVRLYNAAEGAMADMKSLNAQSDIKIGNAAAETFNALLKEVKKALPVPLIQTMTDLNDQDPFLALSLRLRVLTTELGSVAFRD